MKLSVIIVNYNVKYFVEQCLCSVIRATDGLKADIWVVDNDSGDGSMEYLRPRFPQVHFVESGANIGFAKANNLAIGRSEGEYVLLLNPDTLVGEQTLRACTERMEADPQTGGIGVKMLNPDGSFAYESRRGFPSPLTAFFKICGLCALFPTSRLFGRYYMRYLDKDEANPVDILSGACMMLRREALDKTGLLDETFFMYGEDVDLSYRVTKAGYTNVYLPAPILHYKGESTKKESYKYVYTFYEAMRIFFKKHFPHSGLLLSAMVKGAIGLRASVAYLRRFVGRFARRRPTQFRLLVVGGETCLRDVRHICRQNGLDEAHHYVAANERTTANGHLGLDLKLEDFTHVVYDTDCFGYDRILRLMERSAREGHRLSLGTYSTRSHVLITPEQSFV